MGVDCEEFIDRVHYICAIVHWNACVVMKIRVSIPFSIESVLNILDDFKEICLVKVVQVDFVHFSSPVGLWFYYTGVGAKVKNSGA